MKSVHTFILLLLITYISCDCKGGVTDFTVDNCKNNNDGNGYCCYKETPKSSTQKRCSSLSKYEYDHIEVIIEDAKVFGGDNGETKDDDVKIDCKSYYLQSSLIILILLFL
jgi:hypothetical protein